MSRMRSLVDVQTCRINPARAWINLLCYIDNTIVGWYLSLNQLSMWGSHSRLCLTEYLVNVPTCSRPASLEGSEPCELPIGDRVCG